MPRPGNPLLRMTALSMLLACWCGCADMLPWKKNKVAELELAKYGPTANQRIEELKKLADDASDYPHTQQETMAQELALRLGSEQNPLVRRQLVRTLAQFPTEASRVAVLTSMSDSHQLVRVTACEVLGKWGGPDSVQALGHAVSTELEMSVRLAAVRALGEINDPSVVAAIGPALEDPDPALQYRAVTSLESVTREDFGPDVNAWRQYVQNHAAGGQAVESIAGKRRGWF